MAREEKQQLRAFSKYRKSDVRNHPPATHAGTGRPILVSRAPRFALNLQVLLANGPESELFALDWESRDLFNKSKNMFFWESKSPSLSRR